MYLNGVLSEVEGGYYVCIQPSGLVTVDQFACGSFSSLRFKEQVRDMGDSTNGLMKLRPVTFFYKPEYALGGRTLQYGLIAEEVAQVYPELVEFDKDGKPYSIRYQLITTMLLNELQKQYHVAEAQAKQIKADQEEIMTLKQQEQMQNAALQQRLSQLEQLVRTEMAAK
jgi:hypothetical protein